jgi:long-chain acyl-CoA synthetase
MAVKVTRTFDILDKYMEEFPREDALGGKKDGNWYTFSTEEYYKKSHQFALGMLALGIEKGDKVATVTTNRPEWNFADMGMTMTGVVHVPIYPTIGEDEYKYILEHSEAKILIVGDSKLYEKLVPVVRMLPGVQEIYTFEEVEGAKNYEEILTLGESKRTELEAS